MEISPEIFAWLSTLEIIDPFDTMKSPDTKFIIPDKIYKLMMGGHYIGLMLKNLQENYNKFYSLDLNLIEDLKSLKPVDDENKISNSLKYYNWNILFEIMNHFGFNLNKEDINLIINDDKDYLNKILNKIYELTNQCITYMNKNDSKIIDEINNNNKKKIKYEKNENESINLKDLDLNKNYRDINSILEFIIITLSKNLELDIIQSVALLSNNRKYLQNICNKGIKNKFDKIKNWLDDLIVNYAIIKKLLIKYPDSSDIFFSTIGCVLYSKNFELIEICLTLLIRIKDDIEMNYEWFNKEGFYNFIFCIIKHENNIPFIINNGLIPLIKEKINIFFINIRQKIKEEKNKIYEFFSSVLGNINEINKIFSDELKNLIFEIILKEEDDISFKISLLSNIFLNFTYLTDVQINNIFEIFENNLNSNISNIFDTTITMMFNILENFGNIKNIYAPKLYKFIVNCFMNNINFENIYKREFILLNFEKFFNNNQTIPIDIFLNQYLNKIINNKNNIFLIDLIFIYKIIEHPRIEFDQFFIILKYILNVNFVDINFYQIANNILNIIFEKKIIQEKFSSEFEFTEINHLFINYILKIFDKYSNSEKIFDNYYLEMTFNIIKEKFKIVNENILSDLVKTIFIYRERYKKNNTILLQMLWNFDEYDDILLRMEEKYKFQKPDDNKDNEENGILLTQQKKINKRNESGRNNKDSKKNNIKNNNNNNKNNKKFKN